MNRLTFLLLVALVAALPTVGEAQYNLSWEERADLELLLPPSVRVFDVHDTLPNGFVVRAHRIELDLTDPNLELKAELFSPFQNVRQAYEADPNALLAINAGFFSSSASVSMVTSDGTLQARNIAALGRSGQTYYVTRSAFGIDGANNPEINWVYHTDPTTTYKYPNPSPNVEGEAPQPVPSPSFPAGGSLWTPDQAIGAGPVVLRNGVIDVADEELFQSDIRSTRNPRTAVGYKPDGTVVFMIVDGRQYYSDGVLLEELAQMFLDIGCNEAMNMDGGGSSTAVVQGDVLNIPAGSQTFLRSLASAWVLREVTPSVDREIYYFDTEDPTYSEKGAWNNAPGNTYYGSSPSRLCNPATGAERATYHLEDIPSARYQVAMRWSVNDALSTRVPVTIYNEKTQRTVFIDQREPISDGRFNVIGDFTLNPGDSIRIDAPAEGNVSVDALRLIKYRPDELPRGDYRAVVISDMNGFLGATDYEYFVDSIVHRADWLWQADMVLCAGDMVAGQGDLTEQTLRDMWAGWEADINAPLRAAGVPFVYTMGNHDASRSFPAERVVADEILNKAGNRPDVHMVDDTNFPFYYSCQEQPGGDFFIVSWDASTNGLTQAEIDWTEAQFASAAAQSARYRILLGHLPFFAVSSARNTGGDTLNDVEALLAMLESVGVDMYISGHHHAYFPGRFGNIELLQAGATGNGPRRLMTDEDVNGYHTATVVDWFYDQDTVVYTTFRVNEQNAFDMEVISARGLPAYIPNLNGLVYRRDWTGLAQGNMPVIETANDQSLLVSWKPVNLADRYIVQLATDANFQNLVAGYESLSITGTEVLLEGLSGATEYFVRVQPALVAALGSEPEYFGPQSNAVSGRTTLGAPVALEAEIVDGGSFIARWEPVAAATSYRLQVAGDDTFTALLFDYLDFTTTETTELVDDLFTDRTYYYRVQAIAGEETSPYSNTVGATPVRIVHVDPVAEELRLRVYPNPVARNIHIDFPEGVQVERLYLTDVLGNQVRRLAVEVGQRSLHLDMSTLRDGVYFLTADMNGQAQSIKLIKGDSN